MVVVRLAALFFAALISSAFAFGGGSAGRPDGFQMSDVLNCNGTYNCNACYNSPGGRTVRNLAVDTGIRNLVLIVAGQSVMESIAPSAFTPTQAAKVDNFNVCDGAVYAYQDPPLGAAFGGFAAVCCAPPNGGPGNVTGYIADLFAVNNVFDRIITVPLAIGGTLVQDWAPGGPLQDRVCIALSRLAARGIVPQTNVTFGIVWGQGEGNNGNTTQAVYQAALQGWINHTVACGYAGRFFINLETLTGSGTSAPVRAAQAAVANGTNVFVGGDLDGVGNRYDGTHPNNTALSQFAPLIYNAMRASGAPF